jgi:hypothetical protein
LKEIYPPKLKYFANHLDSYSDNNEETITEFELFMLKTLDWNLLPKTCNSWLNIYLQISNLSKTKTEFNASSVLSKELFNDYIKIITLIDLSLFDIESLKYEYSEIAAAAMYLLIKPNELALYSSGFKLNDIQNVINWMNDYANVIINIQESVRLKIFPNIDFDNCRNIQLYFKYLDLMVIIMSHLDNLNLTLNFRKKQFH